MINMPSLRFAEFVEKWEPKDFVEIVDVRNGQDYKHLSEGNIPVYGTGGYMTSVNEALSYEDDAIGIGRKGTIDKPQLLRAPFWTVDTLFYAVPKSGYDLDFVFDLFQNVDWKKKDESTGVPSLSKTAINAVNVCVPRLNEQRQIGRLLTEIDCMITAQQQKYEKLVALKSACLEKMFPKEGDRIPVLRLTGYSSEWKKNKVGKVCSISTGKSNTQDRVNDGLYPFYVRSAIVERSNRYLFDEEAVLTVGDGVGTGKVFHYVNGKYDLHQRVYRMFDFTDEITAKFFYYYFSKYFYKRVMSMTAKTSVDSVRMEMISDMDILYPSDREEQRKIAAILSCIDDLIALQQHRMEKLERFKQAMRHSMFV